MIGQKSRSRNAAGDFFAVAALSISTHATQRSPVFPNDRTTPGRPAPPPPLPSRAGSSVPRRTLSNALVGRPCRAASSSRGTLSGSLARQRPSHLVEHSRGKMVHAGGVGRPPHLVEHSREEMVHAGGVVARSPPPPPRSPSGPSASPPPPEAVRPLLRRSVPPGGSAGRRRAPASVHSRGSASACRPCPAPADKALTRAAARRRPSPWRRPLLLRAARRGAAAWGRRAMGSPRRPACADIGAYFGPTFAAIAAATVDFPLPASPKMTMDGPWRLSSQTHILCRSVSVSHVAPGPSVAASSDGRRSRCGRAPSGAGARAVSAGPAPAAAPCTTLRSAAAGASPRRSERRVADLRVC